MIQKVIKALKTIFLICIFAFLALSSYINFLIYLHFTLLAIFTMEPNKLECYTTLEEHYLSGIILTILFEVFWNISTNTQMKMSVLC